MQELKRIKGNHSPIEVDMMDEVTGDPFAGTTYTWTLYAKALAADVVPIFTTAGSMAVAGKAIFPVTSADWGKLAVGKSIMYVQGVLGGETLILEQFGMTIEN